MLAHRDHIFKERIHGSGEASNKLNMTPYPYNSSRCCYRQRAENQPTQVSTRADRQAISLQPFKFIDSYTATAKKWFVFQIFGEKQARWSSLEQNRTRHHE
jgi:hypothetical protein